tara:strand:+ start:248 stop:436 length:189 start_codon:yes stop_codon:yes gene_type:complete
MKITETKEVQDKRLKICRSCEHRSKKFLMIFNADSCSVCKCNLKAKTLMSAEMGGKCPVGKW